MKYVTGVYGLNIENSKETCGDWHTSALDWSKVSMLESKGSIWGDWGIESSKSIPEHDGLHYVADDMHSVLDLMGVYGRLRWLRGFRNDFFCTDRYNQEFLEKVYMLRGKDNWEDICSLMKREFMWEWDKFLRSREM